MMMELPVAQVSQDDLAKEESEVNLELLEKLDHQDQGVPLDQEESGVRMVQWVHQVLWDQLDREDLEAQVEIEENKVNLELLVSKA